MEQEETVNSLRTRSKAAPDWTVEESLILVNEISAIEADCRGTLSSFQKWKIIVENCNALDVNRNLNQCRRKWDTLLSDYKRIKHSGSNKPSFNFELFKVVERHVKDYGFDSDADDTDPEDLVQIPEVGLYGSKNQRAKAVPAQKHTIEEKEKPMRHLKSEDIEVEECSSEKRVRRRRNTVDESTKLVEINLGEHEQNIAEKLRHNAELIEAIVKEQVGVDLINDHNDLFELSRINGDKIINCLGNLASTLNELCKMQTNSVV
uniref:uncharacterized protein LOC122609974 n=1 Tax=Erigeron canadensis TaxID=72917 RepID=UPI001CB987E2|nr:uncharacterized protein LOC122609974 [Erigeron canadensis]